MLSLVAPFRGIVTALSKSAGEIVDTSTIVLTLVDPTKILVRIQLSEEQASAVSVGDRAVITTGAARGVVGSVATINATLDPATRTLEALITPVAGSALRPGASASARITVRTVDDAYVVPTRAIVKDPETGQALVFTPISGGAYRRVPVRIVLQSGGYAAIQAPHLATIRRVATDGAYELLPYAVGGDSS